MRTLNADKLTEIENFIKTFQKEKGKSPSYREVMHGVKMSSLNLVQRYVLALERDNRITRTRLGNIDIPKQLKMGNLVSVPLVGNIACGEPNTAIENIEGNFTLPRDIFGNGELFMLRAYGNSMIEVGIQKDDLIVLKKQNYADEGDIVVALVDGNATLKRFFRNGKKIVLHPENKSMQDIVVDECEVQGVLIGCIKMF